jgi:hypothetical protein
MRLPLPTPSTSLGAPEGRALNNPFADICQQGVSALRQTEWPLRALLDVF